MKSDADKPSDLVDTDAVPVEAGAAARRYVGRDPTPGHSPVRVFAPGDDPSPVGGRALPMARDVADRSSGFSWGYGGSGPMQLAVALVADVTTDDAPDDAVFQLARQVVDEVVSEAPNDGRFETDGAAVLAAADLAAPGDE